MNVCQVDIKGKKIIFQELFIIIVEEIEKQN